MSFLGPYDRELDSDEEELSFEEQFILRMPPGEDCSKLREMVAAREISPDVWFKLKGTLSQYAFSKHITGYFE
jgi:transcription initiation factor TFIID subunit 7